MPGNISKVTKLFQKKDFVTDQSPNIAVLFFSRSAPAEAACKQFIQPGRHTQNANIAQSLISHTLRQIKQARLPYFHIDEQHQIGSNFGERFSHAFNTLFDRGYDYVISVGNDIPQMQAHHIREAANKLRSGKKIVLGPDTDGGTWLMGYSREAFSADRFRQLPWNTDRLLDAILKKQCGGEIELLQTLSDIDDPQALATFAQRRYSDQVLLRLIQKLLAILSGAFYTQLSTPFVSLQTPSFRPHLLRGPPLCD